MARVPGPVLGVFQDVEQMSLGQVRAYPVLKGHQAFGPGGGVLPFQVGNPVWIQGELGIFREAGVHFLG